MCLCLSRSERAQQHAAPFIFLTDNLHLHSSSQERTEQNNNNRNVCGVCAFPVWNFMDFLVFSFSQNEQNKNWRKKPEKSKRNRKPLRREWIVNIHNEIYAIPVDSLFLECVCRTIFSSILSILMIFFSFYSKLHYVHTISTNVRFSRLIWMCVWEQQRTTCIDLMFEHNRCVYARTKKQYIYYTRYTLTSTIKNSM